MVKRLRPQESPADSAERRFRVDAAARAILKTLFDLENRTRALEGRTALTRAQFLQLLRSRAT